MVIGSCFPPRIGGSAVIMRELLTRFDSSSYTVVTMSKAHDSSDCASSDNVIRVLSSGRLPWRLQGLWRTMQIPWAVRKLQKEVVRRNVRVIVGVYPDREFLSLAQKVAKITKIPLVVYLHDTIAEGLSHTFWRWSAVKLQKDVFTEASSILVMSDGMVDLYRRKYGVVSRALPHIYAETIPDQIPPVATLKQAFWGGAVYGINSASLRRISDVLSARSIPFLLATNASVQNLATVGICGNGIKVEYIGDRKKYLDTVCAQGILVLALSWPDESSMHEDELSTIFPTKTPEYLASGRPILVHCPKEYFLARFFAEHKCGLVVSDRSPDSLAAACQQLLKDNEITLGFRQNAFIAARRFAPDAIMETFKDAVDCSAQMSWGQKVN